MLNLHNNNMTRTGDDISIHMNQEVATKKTSFPTIRSDDFLLESPNIRVPGADSTESIRPFRDFGVAIRWFRTLVCLAHQGGDVLVIL